MHDNSRITENRINRVLAERLAPAGIVRREPLQVAALHLPGEPCSVDELDPSAFEPVAAGTMWGAPWGTTWFSASAELPARADLLPGHGVEVLAEIGFSGAMAGFETEAAVYVDGRIRCGVHPRRRAIPARVLRGDAPQDEAATVAFLIEAAANPNFSSSFAPSPLGERSTAGDAPLYRFGGVELVEFDETVRCLVRELSNLRDLIRTLPRGNPRRQRLTAIAERCLAVLALDDIAGTAAAARGVLAEAFAVPSAPGSHRLSAVGHAHIDTAWLWPMRETRRKCARTFSNQLRLMEDYPEHLFACSQAAQYEFVQQDHPELFEEVRRRADEGRWLPVGAMWVEADMNLPSGESLVRQLVHGQRYFEEHFGMRCSEVWLPDVFGYPASLPQVFRQGGCSRFLTQKLSWNKQNRFPHHSFLWEGIDGSSVVAHFPPVETYNSELTASELSFASSNFADHAWSDNSLVPFGHGDGGGGPTAEMLERARLLGDLAGLPRLSIRPPGAFFEDLEAELLRPGTPHWRGELYFEMHRGTLTSQAHTKVGNRRCEELLREVELWAATLDEGSWNEELDRLWKRVLTQQFHDILPGSSISWVHRDAEREHAEVIARCSEILQLLLDRLPGGDLVTNASSRPRTEVLRCGSEPGGAAPTQELRDGTHAALVHVPGLGTAELVPLRPAVAVTAGDGHLANGILEVRFDGRGSVASVRDLRFDRELVPEGRRCANLQISPDNPVEFDAWDLEQWAAPSSLDLPDAHEVTVTESGPLLGSVEFRRRFGASEVTQTYTLCAGSARLEVHLEIDWAEHEKYLSMDFPLRVRAESAACEVQFGKVDRPTHTNTSWDAAKFEVCAHRWVDLSEPGFGVAVLNDGRYGHSLQGGGIRVSLLRAPSYPDPSADRGHHSVTLALLPHGPDRCDVLREAEALNQPLRFRPRAAAADGAAQGPTRGPVVGVGDERVGVSAVKLADDGSGDLIVRVWESVGDHVTTELTSSRPIGSVRRCNLLEESEADGHPLVSDGTARLELEPFQLLTIRLRRASSAPARSPATS